MGDICLNSFHCNWVNAAATASGEYSSQCCFGLPELLITLGDPMPLRVTFDFRSVFEERVSVRYGNAG